MLDAGVDLLAQQLIPGAEAQIESYHCYVDQRGSIAGEFTGRKIRTFPVTYGHTTALEITAAADVQRQGRDIVERLGLTGVAKLDFKRDQAGALHLFEINPRFSASCPLRAAAGVNEPDILYRNFVLGEEVRTEGYERLVCLRYWNEVYLPYGDYEQAKRTGRVRGSGSWIPDYF